MIKYIRSFSFEIKKKRRIHLFYRDFMTFASNGNVYQKIARNDKFYLIYITSVSLVLMIINELSLFLSLSLSLSLWKKHETTITKEKLTFSVSK